MITDKEQLSIFYKVHKSMINTIPIIDRKEEKFELKTDHKVLKKTKFKRNKKRGF